MDPNPPVEEEVSASPAATQTDRYLVLLKEAGGANALRANTAAADVARLGGRVERAHGVIGVLQVRDLSRSAAAELGKRADVEAMVRDRRIQWLPPTPQLPMGTRRLRFGSSSNQRGAEFFREYQWNLRVIRAHLAWDVSRQGEGVTVCILDTGVDPRHIDLQGKLNLEISASFVGNERADRDFATHGTAMASIVSSNGLGMASVAPDSRICSVKVLDRTGFGTVGDVLAGIMYVGAIGVDVANMSLSSGPVPLSDPDVKAEAQALQRAINYSTNRGVLFVASAGNEDTNLNPPGLISLPGGLNNVISVGATGPIGQEQFDRIASYSNVGSEEVDIFAPGGEFGFATSVAQDLILMACSPSLRADGTQPCSDRNVYLISAGTSPAAAHVSGAAAVIEADLPGDQSPAELRACLLENANDIGRPLLTGSGRLNVLRAQDCGAPGANLVASR